MPFAFLQTTIIVCLVLGLCRVGSLEKYGNQLASNQAGLCRVGSLEMFCIDQLINNFGLCRVGSLEITLQKKTSTK